jgi:hypothetical protein
MLTNSPYLLQLGIYWIYLIKLIYFDFQISAPPFRQMASLQTGPWSIPSRLGDDLESTSVRIGARPASYVAGSFFSPVSGAYAGKMNIMTFNLTLNLNNNERGSLSQVGIDDS